uniref:Orf23 n=1 Tax=Photorhabdus luminescens TaxID=29488 RepID=Q8GDJ8_PHOLU|nr:Orf23 [Photorhabdus luminescens]
MDNQDALFPTVKDDIAFETLLTQAKTVVEQQSGQLWSNTAENDPGITLLEAGCYGASDLAYRHSLPLRDLLTPEKQEQTSNDGIFPQEFGPQQMLTCGPITAEDYRRALLDLHSSNNINDKSEGYFFFNDVQLVREPESERYQYWYNKQKREYSFIQTPDSQQLTLRGNYWLYLLPSRETEADKVLAQQSLAAFLKNNRNLGESVSKIIWLQPTDFLLQLDIELDDDVRDIADIFAKVYMTTAQMILATPLRYTTQAMKELGYSNEEIFAGPYLHHGWIPELPAAKDYTKPTELKLSHLANRLLAIPGVQSITQLALGKHDENISPLADDNWSWTIAQRYYPRLWGNDPLGLISSPASPLTITAKGGVKVAVSKQDIASKVITEPLIETQPELLNWGKHRKVLDYYPVSNKLPACYGLQTYAETQQQVHLHQFMLPFEQMLANGCAELAILPKLLAFKQRGNAVYGTQWPFKANTVGQKVHQEIMPNLIKQLNNDSQINNDDGIHRQNYAKELSILNYLLEYFGTHRAARPLTLDSLDFLFTQRGYLAQQPELTYQRNNIRVDKVSALQKRIAARIGLGGECFKDNPNLANLPFYLIEHRQLLPVKPDKKFDSEQKPDNLEIKSDPNVKNHQLIITQKGTADQLFHGQVINLIIIEGDRKFILRGQMITDITGDAFSLNTRNSTDLERNLNRVEQAFKQGNLRWCNSPVWMEDMDYQLVYASDTYQTGTEDERWITSSTQSPFPAMLEVNDEITLKYVITPYGPATKILANSDSPTDYELKAQVVEFDRIKGRILIKKIPGQQYNFPKPEDAWRYHWYFSNEKYALADRFSFMVSVVINRQLIENDKVDPYKLEAWVKTEILAEFPAHLSMIFHWLSPEHFKNFASTYKRWQNNGAPLGDEAYNILETLTLGRLPSAATGTGNMRIATEQQRKEVIGDSGTEWNEKVIEDNQLLYVPKIQTNIQPK